MKGWPAAVSMNAVVTTDSQWRGRSCPWPFSVGHCLAQLLDGIEVRGGNDKQLRVGRHSRRRCHIIRNGAGGPPYVAVSRPVHESNPRERVGGFVIGRRERMLRRQDRGGYALTQSPEKETRSPPP